MTPIREEGRKVRFAGIEPDASPSSAAAQEARISDTSEGPRSAASVSAAREKGLSEQSGPAVEGIDEIGQVAPAKAGHAAMRAEIGMDLGQPAPAPLNDGDLARVKEVLDGEGLALRRMNERAARAGGVVARMGLNAPRPLEGSRRAAFVALVNDDIANLAENARIERPSAAELLLRAVDTGQMGTRLRPGDKELLREVLAQLKA